VIIISTKQIFSAIVVGGTWQSIRMPSFINLGYPDCGESRVIRVIPR